MIKHFLVAGVLSIFSLNVFGWGALGHKTTGKVAWALLDSDTQSKVLKMLNGGDIADAAVWPDVARGGAEWKFSIWYHFEKAPDNVTYLQNLQNQDPGLRKLGGLIEALYTAEDVIKNPASSADDKAIALKFVIHCIGDIHQPFHTGRPEDMSGNKIPVKWLGADTTLHAVWDSQMIYLGHKDILNPQSVLPNSDNDSAQNYANYLLTKFKDFKPDASMFVKYDDWMHESMVPRADAYAAAAAGLSEQDYTNKFIDVVDQRIYFAGLRIAWALKRLVNQESSTQPLDTLRSAIVSIVGDFTKFVSLKPRQLANPPSTPTPPETPSPFTPAELSVLR
ncbi:MAG: S1/P1 nuclease [Pseudobdellovibrio sp.]